MPTISQMQAAVHDLMERKGFHAGRTNGRDDLLVRLCLIHSEVTEAVQEVKRHWTDQGTPALKAKVAEELADVVIRVLDMAGCLGVNLEAFVTQKHAKNAARPHAYGTPREDAAPTTGAPPGSGVTCRKPRPVLLETSSDTFYLNDRVAARQNRNSPFVPGMIQKAEIAPGSWCPMFFTDGGEGWVMESIAEAYRPKEEPCPTSKT